MDLYKTPSKYSPWVKIGLARGQKFYMGLYGENLLVLKHMAEGYQIAYSFI